MEKDENDVGTSIKNVIRQTIEDISEGLKDKKLDLMSTIDFELSVVTQQGSNGKIDLKVLGLKKDVATQNIQKIRFSVGDPTKPEQDMKRAKNFIKILFKEAKKMDNPKKVRKKRK